MTASAVCNVIILVILIGLAWWCLRILREPPLKDGEIRLRDIQKIMDNERVLKGRDSVGLDEDVSNLHEHPTIKCRWSNNPKHGGPRPAVWQHSMEYPVCKECLHEDPYE